MNLSQRNGLMVSPYRGIQPFRYLDKAYFFGREKTVNELLVKVLLSRLVVLFGESGSGKSSLINAGLLPALKKEGLSPERLRLRPIPDEPILIERVQISEEDDGQFLPSIFVKEEPAETDTGERFIACSLERFVTMLHNSAADAHPVLLFDQFEELFTLFEQTEYGPEVKSLQDRLISGILQIVKDEFLRAKVVIILREDFLGRLEILARDYPQILDQRVRLGLLDKDSAKKAIIGPFEQEPPFPCKLSDDLAETIIRDLSQYQPRLLVQPTQLQIVCSRLWGEHARTKSEITIQEYTRMGGIKGILEGFLESELLEFDSSSREPAIMILANLITNANTRDVVSLEKLRRLVVGDEKDEIGKQFSSVINSLETRRLLDQSYQRETQYYEISSEYLIPSIRKEQQQLAAARASAEAERKAAEERRRAEEQRLLAEERGRAARRLKYLFLGMAFLFFVATGMGAFGWYQWKKAESLSKVSLTRKLLKHVDEQLRLGKRDDLTALLARQAYLLSKDSGQHELLLSAQDALRTVLGGPYFSHILGSHGSLVSSVVFSPHGKTLASASDDKTVRLWDLSDPSDPKTLKTLEGHEGLVNSVVFSPDGKTLASASDDKTVRLWDLSDPSDPKTLKTLEGHEGLVNSMAFSPDGKTLASASDDKTVRLWDLEAGRSDMTILRGHKEAVKSVAFSPDGSTLASAGGENNKTILLWDARNPRTEPKPLLRPGNQGTVFCVAFSPDGKTLASASDDMTVLLWDLSDPSDPKTLETLKGHVELVNSVAFNPDGKTLASASDDNTVRLWDLTDPSDPKRFETLGGHKNWVISVAFSPDGKTLASADGDGIIRLWDLEGAGSDRTILRGHKEAVKSVAFSRDGSSLASAGEDKTILLWDPRKPSAEREPLPLTGHQGKVNCVAFSPDGKTLASASDDMTVQVWDVSDQSDPKTLKRLEGHEDRVNSVTFSPDGKMLASASDDNTVRLWDLSDPTDPKTLKPLKGHEDWVKSVAFNPDGKTLASASDDNTVRLWDLTDPSDPKTLKPLKGHEDWVNSVAFSPDGKTLASADDDGIIRLWDLGKPFEEPISLVHPPLEDRLGSVRSLAFSPDGMFLASAGRGGAVRLWDLSDPSDPKRFEILEGHKDLVNSVAFSPDGETLASASKDNIILIWALKPERLATRVCEKVWRNLSDDEWKEFVSKDIPRPTCPYK